MKHILFLSIACSFLLSSCAGLSGGKLERKYFKGKPLDSHFSGFVLFDPETQQTLLKKNEDKYFTPASNTKLFTFYAGLKLLGDSLVGMQYAIKGDSLIFRGTGDPTFLHPDFPHQPVFDFLKNTDYQLFFVPGFYDERAFGPGWAWDDYAYSYQAERSDWPIYGNFISVYKDGEQNFRAIPDFFDDFIEVNSDIKSRVVRDPLYNLINVNPDLWAYRNDTTEVPFKYSDNLLKVLLEDTLGKKINLLPSYAGTFDSQIKSVPTREVFARMLQASDNFLAEQLLIQSSIGLSTKMKGVNTIFKVKNQYFKHFEQDPIWIDASGLSRYNLFTPTAMAQLAALIYQEMPAEELFRLLPAGGVSGTLKNWYKADTPYVFAKTGTLSNNHCLTGYIKTNSGKVLIFSFMNNNFPGGSAAVKQEMEKVLLWVRDKY